MKWAGNNSTLRNNGKERVKDMKKKSVLSLDAWVAVSIIGIITVLLVEGFVRQDIPALGARFPLVVFGVVILTGVAELVRCVRARKAEIAAAEQAGKADAPSKPAFKNLRNFLVISAMVVVYSVAMHYLGFIISSIVFFIAFVLHFKFRRVVLFSVCSSVCIVLVYFCFTRLMHVRLPVGELVRMFL